MKKNKIFHCNIESLNCSSILENIKNIKVRNKKTKQKIIYIHNKLLLNYNQNLIIELIKLQKQYVLTIINEVINTFQELKEIPHITFIHGSYAKTINRYYSDIDLNILCSEKYRDKIIIIEELICIMLYKIFGFNGRDKVHNIMLYIPIIGEKKYNIIGNKYVIEFLNNETLNYKCRNNYEEIMPKILNSSRDYFVFEEYIKKNSTTNSCEEWCSSFEFLSSNTEEYNVYNTINLCDKNIISSSTFKLDTIKLIENLINEMSKELPFKEEYISISSLNKMYKVRELRYIYKSLSLIRRILVYKNEKIIKIDFFDIINNKYLNNNLSKNIILNYKDTILRYLWSLMRIEKMMKQCKYNFSSREQAIVYLKQMDALYNKLYKEKFIDFQEKMCIQLHNSINNMLTETKRLLE